MPLRETTSYRRMPTVAREPTDLLSNPTKHYPITTQVFDIMNRPGMARSTSSLGIPKRAPSSSSSSSSSASDSSMAVQYTSLEVSTKYPSREEEKGRTSLQHQLLEEEEEKDREERRQALLARDHQIACQLFIYSYNEVPLKEYANFLGQRGNEGILREYMQLLRPLPLSLLSVLQRISEKIYFAAEAQRMDNILEEASKVYVIEHPNTMWKSNYQLCHIILFSLLILNSDLHNSYGIAGKQSRFSPDAFIENTIGALQTELNKSNITGFNLQTVRTALSHELLSYYEALRYKPLALLNLRKVKRMSAMLPQSKNSTPLIKSPARRSLESPRDISDQQTRSFSVGILPHRRSRSVSRSNSTSSRASRTSSNSINFSSPPSTTSGITSSTAVTTSHLKGSSQQYPEQQCRQRDLYLKEDFDIEMNKRNHSFWYMEATIKLNEQDVVRLKARAKNLRKTNLDVTSTKNRRSDSNSKTIITSSDTETDTDVDRMFDPPTIYISSPPQQKHKKAEPATITTSSTTSKHSRFLGWLRGKSSSSSSPSPLSSSSTTTTTTMSSSSKSHTPLLNKQSMSYLDDTSKYRRVHVKVSEGRMSLYFAEKTNDSSTVTLTATTVTMAQNTPSYCFNLFGTVASVVQENIIRGSGTGNITTTAAASSSSNTNSKGNFTLSFPRDVNGEKLVLEFETKSVHEALLFVNSLNFWAGRLSPLPLSQFEAVSNEEYGWSDKVLKLLDARTTSGGGDGDGDGKERRSAVVEYLNTKVRISQWRPLLGMDALYGYIDEVPKYRVTLRERIRELREFTTRLGQLIDIHNEVKPRLVKLWQDTLHFEKVMDNWNERYLFLNKQYKRREIYLATLQRAWGSLSRFIEDTKTGTTK